MYDVMEVARVSSLAQGQSRQVGPHVIQDKWVWTDRQSDGQDHARVGD